VGVFNVVFIPIYAATVTILIETHAIKFLKASINGTEIKFAVGSSSIYTVATTHLIDKSSVDK
jgi:K+-transporting ATPase A subunit